MNTAANGAADEREFATVIEQDETIRHHELNRSDVHFDEQTEIEIGEPGYWIQTWLFVPWGSDADPCRKCGARPGTPGYGTVGDGFDGLCPSCADKAEAAGEFDE